MPSLTTPDLPTCGECANAQHTASATLAQLVPKLRYCLASGDYVLADEPRCLHDFTPKETPRQ